MPKGRETFPVHTQKKTNPVSGGQAAWIQVPSTALTRPVTWSYLLSLSTGLLINKIKVSTVVRIQ